MQSLPNPTSGRNSAQMPLGAMRSTPGSGTLAESLSEIRELLHAFDEGGGADAPAGQNAPAADEPERAEPDDPSDGAVAPPDPIPAAMPQAAPLRRRNGLAVAALAAGGLAVLGAAGLVSAGGSGLPLMAVSTAGKGQAGRGRQSEVMASAVLPPARSATMPKDNAVPEPPAGTGHRALRHGDSGAWRLPPAETRAATPVIALGGGDRSQSKSRDRTGQIAAVEHHSAAAAFAPRPAAAREADLAPATEERPRQPRRARFGLRAAQRPAEQTSRRGKPSHDDQPALRAARMIAAGPARVSLHQNEDGGLRSRTETAVGPKQAQALPALAWQHRTATYPPARGVGSHAPEFSTSGRVRHAPAVATGRQRPADRSTRSFPPAGRIEEAGGSLPEPSAAGRADYAPVAAAGWRQPAAWGNRGFAPEGRIEEADRAQYAPAAAGWWRSMAWGSRNASPDPPMPQGGTIIEGRLPPYGAPPPPPPRWRPPFRRWGPPGPPLPLYHYAPYARPFYPARWRRPFRRWGPPGPPPPPPLP